MLRPPSLPLLLAILMVPLIQGCSVIMVAHQPLYRDLSVLAPGTDRAAVIAVLGPPVSTSKTMDGGKQETYSFTQGYKPKSLEMRGLFYIVADVMTLGLWEAAGTPIEAHFDGKKMTLSVTYDAGDHVVDSTLLSSENPYPNGMKAVMGTLVGSNHDPEYKGAQTPDCAVIAAPVTQTSADGNASGRITRVDGYVANFMASDPGWVRFLLGKKPLYLSPGPHGLAVESIAVDGASTADSQGGTVLAEYVVTADAVLKVDIAPHSAYRLTVTREEQNFTFTLWDETEGRDKRTAAAQQVAYGKSQYEVTGYIEPSN